MTLNRHKCHWSRPEDAYLRDFYGTTSWAQLVGALGRTKAAIVTRACSLGLHRPGNRCGPGRTIVEITPEERGMRIAQHWPTRIPQPDELIEFMPMSRSAAYRSIRRLKDVRGIA